MHWFCFQYSYSHSHVNTTYKNYVRLFTTNGSVCLTARGNVTKLSNKEDFHCTVNFNAEKMTIAYDPSLPLFEVGAELSLIGHDTPQGIRKVSGNWNVEKNVAQQHVITIDGNDWWIVDDFNLVRLYSNFYLFQACINLLFKKMNMTYSVN
jgi:hypothetical protein